MLGTIASSESFPRQRGSSKLLRLTLPRVTARIGIAGMLFACLLLSLAYGLDAEMAKAFWLGAFSTTFGGSIVLVLTSKLVVYGQDQRAARIQKAQDQMLRQLVDASPMCISYVNREQRLQLMNRAYKAWFGFEDGNELDNRTLHEVVGHESYAEIHPFVEAALRGESARYETDILLRNGERYYVDRIYTPHFDEEGAVLGFFDIMLDITSRKEAQAALRRSEVRHRTLVENAPVGILEIELGGEIASANPCAQTMLALPEQDPLPDYTTVVSSDQRKRVAKYLRRAARGDSVQFEFRSSGKDGAHVFAASLIPLHGSDQEVGKVMGVLQDITDAQNLADELSYQARYDSLTGLVNRREFELRLKRVLETARRQKTENALCYLDLDQFKVINDTCGHVAGDELLRQVGAALSEGIRKRDTLARLGGDEFGILMEHCSIEQAARVAHKLRELITELRFPWDDKSFNIGVSIGVVAIDEASEGLTGILSAADTACYAAKDRGRNRVHVYQHDDHELLRRHGEMQWVVRIQEALEKDQFRLSFQSIVPFDAKLAKRKRYEFLLRMETDTGEIVPPGAFLPAAERYNLAVKIDKWVLQHAMAWLEERSHVLEGMELFSINLSGHSLVDEEFLRFARNRIGQSSVPASKICFEITETAAIANLTSATRFIRTLKTLGCHFALDDFGSGLSSFAYLKTLPVDYLKIDGVFVKDILVSPVDMAMVRSINEIGQVMKKKTIAEFVESQPVADKLKEMGIDYSQGYLHGRPRPLEDLDER